MESVALIFDAVVILVVWRIVRRLSSKPLPQENYRPSDDDARSGRRVTLLIRRKP